MMAQSASSASRNAGHGFVDQAEGLRKLLRGPGLRVLPVFGAPERVAACVNLAAAAAAEGSRVVLLDPSAGDIARAYGLAARYELRHLLSGEKRFDQVALATMCGVRVVPASRGIQQLAEAGGQGEALFGAFARLDEPADLVVLHGATLSAAGVLPAAGGEVLVALSPANESLTAAYAAIKSLSQSHGVSRFRTLVLEAGEQEAARVHAGLAAMAQERFGVAVLAGGAIAPDAALRRAQVAHRSVLATDPQGASARAWRRIAAASAAWTLAEIDVAAGPSAMN
jgi:flagellar biosynthesis protein FlhG